MTHAQRPLPARISASVLIAALCVTIALLAPARAAATATEQLVIGFKPTATARGRAASIQAAVPGVSSAALAGATVPQLNVVTVAVEAADVSQVRRRLAAQGNVLWVERDHVARAFWNPGDPHLFQQWGLPAIHASTAWDRTRGSGVTIAVVDTGVAYNHEDLQGKVDQGFDYVDNDSNPMDVNGHGTHVAGIAAGTAGNGRGGSGLAPGARILAVRVLDGNGTGYYSWIAKGITYAADHGAKVINLSLGGPDPAEVLKEAIAYAVARGSVVTCASGNDGVGKVSYPAAYEDCISVGATASDGTRADFSNYGSGLDVVAPGQGILSTTRNGGYESWDGTSMATPFVSGLAALLAAQGLSHRQIVETIEGTAHDSGVAGYDTRYGWGLIDAAAATGRAAEISPLPVDTTAPSVDQIAIGQMRTEVTTTKTKQWKRVRATRWRTVGTTEFLGDYAWRDIAPGANSRTYQYYRMHRGLVQRRTVVMRRVTVIRRIQRKVRDITMSATDDQRVDRFGLKVDGHWVGTDWIGADGWAVAWRCAPGTHSFVGFAWDARDNGATRQVTASITC